MEEHYKNLKEELSKLLKDQEQNENNGVYDDDLATRIDELENEIAYYRDMLTPDTEELDHESFMRAARDQGLRPDKLGGNLGFISFHAKKDPDEP